MLVTSPRRRCRVCGASQCVCGGSAGWSGQPIDRPTRQERPAVALRRYNVTVRGYRTVMLLDEKTAAAYGDNATPADEPTLTEPTEPTSKARRAANKSRTPADK